ncbi:DNA-binding MarR family transcriptional regulator [Antricoccus suffuscus]|uniref:DNA-binding MarR family transcriptional regulator n=1 Tax=Antricoccus suffuscus TaxID=1629062 RepID=A0A2T0ZJY1_9ACTN|nr:MarR family winged helix-turn-helix transcriptional regulator [Antricoccus suffuscus]PRZ36615.1 DNA-binding MarR family transcriptional regulator [Antricoccus suffuscus]
MTQATHPDPEDTDALDDIVRSLLSVVRAVHKGFESMALDKGALMVLTSIRHFDKSRPSSVAEFCGLDISTISRHIKKLEEDDLVERSPDPADGRAHLMRLSAKGSAMLAHAEHVRREELGSAISGWNEEDRRELRAILGRLAADLQTTAARHMHAVPHKTT